MFSLESYFNVFARCFGLIVILPLGESFPVTRVWLSGCLAAMLVDMGGVDLNAATLLTNLLIGLSFSAPLCMAIGFSEMIGEIFDSSRGQTIANIYDPLTSQNSSVISLATKNYVWVSLLIFGYLERLMHHFFISFTIPANSTLENIGKLLLGQATILGSLFLSIMFPFSVIFIAIELVFGFVSKLVPGNSFNNESFIFKSMIGFLGLYLMERFGVSSSIEQLIEPLADLKKLGL